MRSIHLLMASACFISSLAHANFAASKTAFAKATASVKLSDFAQAGFALAAGLDEEMKVPMATCVTDTVGSAKSGYTSTVAFQRTDGKLSVAVGASDWVNPGSQHDDRWEVFAPSIVGDVVHSVYVPADNPEGIFGNIGGAVKIEFRKDAAAVYIRTSTSDVDLAYSRCALGPTPALFAWGYAYIVKDDAGNPVIFNLNAPTKRQVAQEAMGKCMAFPSDVEDIRDRSKTARRGCMDDVKSRLNGEVPFGFAIQP